MAVGTVFDVREFTVHDGPGCRITFFLKGCPLTCIWCHNPEGQRRERELMVRDALCTRCGLCRKNTESADFLRYGRDISACPQGLLSVAGEEITPEGVLARVLPMKEMLLSMEGGVTFSGGEPLAQPEFLSLCLDLLGENGIHRAIETSGFSSESVFYRTAIERCDYVMMDLKLMDDGAHRRYTGVSNEGILRNARILMESGVDFEFRTPLIPGITDTEENLRAIGEFVGSYKWEKIPYNPLAGAKYAMLGREYPYDAAKHSSRINKI